MRRLIVPLTLTLAAAASGFACSSDTDPGQGLAGGATGKGGGANPGAGGGTAATSATGSGATGGTSVIVPTGGSSSGTAGSTSGTAGSTSGASGASGASCTGTTATGQKGAGAVVLFLVDTSLSMASAPSGGGGRGMMGGGTSKMASTQTALNSAFTQLSPSLNVGLVFFPHVPISTMPCFDPTVEVPIGVLDAPQLNLLTTQVTGVTPDGSTPTHDAFDFAVETLRTTTAQGDKYIVLITDGEPTYTKGCVGTGMAGQMLDNQPLLDAAGAAFTTDGIKTFVVGSPGSETARTPLSAIARLGGTGPTGCMDSGTPEYCHFDMTTTSDFAASLSAALGMITQQIPVDCAFDLPRPPAGMSLDLSLVNVTVTNDDATKTEIARDPAGDCATDGWVYVGDPPTAVQLCGNLCETVKAQGMPSIDVQFGCAQRVNPPR